MNYLNNIMKEKVPLIKYDLLEKTGLVEHGFSTRKGGVSKGYFSTMNLSFTRGDDTDLVRQNYSIIGAELNMPMERMVLSAQTHTTNIRIVSEKDAGKGVVREKDYEDVDGLMTNIPQLPLVTFYADCVPLFFLDPVNKVIALSHSGWRGTVQKMGKVTVEKMQSEYGSNPEDILSCIGPSICQKCYEVSEDVADEFKSAFNNSDMMYKKENGKYQLDLWKANEMVLQEAGIRKCNIENREICTCCNKDVLFSHRATDGKRGNLAAFMMLR